MTPVGSDLDSPRCEAPVHTSDADCAPFLDADDQCTVCGVSHTSLPCEWCSGVGFHAESCGYRDCGTFYPSRALVADIARRANEASGQSRNGGAPALTAESPRGTVVRWLQWCDPNGCHEDALAAAEDCDPYDLKRAWEAVRDMLDASA